MKFDKETMTKHHFWFLLAGAMPLALIAIFILMTVVSAEIAKSRKDLETALTQTKVSEPAKNAEWVAGKKKQADEMKKKEKLVWEKAYNDQNKYFTWPDAVEKKYNFKTGLFFSEIKVDKTPPPASQPAEPRAEDHSVVKQYTGKLNMVNDEFIQVATGKELKRFHPTRKVKLINGDGKEVNAMIDLVAGLQPKDYPYVNVTYIVGKYFNDPLTDKEQTDYGHSYKEQIEPILQQVQPVNAKGEGVVQLRGWVFREGAFPPENATFLRYVAKDWDLVGDISEEAWIAQEDLWLQREFYRLVRQTNDMVSMFEGKGGKERGKWYTFTNPYWKLELNLAGPKKLALKITNLLRRRQRLDLDFLVKFREDAGVQPERITIGGEPLNPGNTKTIEKDIQGPPPRGIFGVQQPLNWETAAVRRIDHIAIGSLADGDCCQSNRTFPEGLKPYTEKKEAPGAADKAAGPGPGGAGPPGGGLGGPVMGPRGPGQGKVEENKTKNSLSPERYFSQPTPQVRRVPFGIVLIVDQEHLDRLMFVVSQSPLRILTTQVIVDRYPGSLRPAGAHEAAPEGAGGFPGINPRGPGPGAGFPPFGGGMPPFGPMGGLRGGNMLAPAAPAGDHGQEANLEVVVYGIASLYQRYPPRPAGTTP